ncbi:putative 2-dehydropantoate 2-reductase [Pelovirga terrestris]|uniref:2-dehydropantoate 2-reductase n=1 Tax=Pelovirga terrestris TaxID=2771352 RepID=A0A8J6QXH1_9BACT|nr:putative 2-dehydropantoate 2-reductase [Pelovirga terrestris]MBD1400302.1 putative 2-dehydropantoate 2-reductase [Pelovirga terrestris]
MRIAIVGAGALGLYYGAMLQRSGLDVCFLLRRDYQAITTGGLQVRSVNGDFYLAQIKAFRTPQEIGVADLVIVGLKTFSNAQMGELMRPLIGKETAILTLQNGLGNEELLAESFGPERVLGGIAFLCSNRGEPGVVCHLGEGRIRLGEFGAGLTPRSEKLAAMFRDAGVPCEAVADLRRARWEKLVWNIPFNGLSALLGQDVTELLTGGHTRELVRELMLEVIAGANAQGLSNEIDGPIFSKQMITLTDQMDHYRPSMQIDREEGRPLELDAIFAIPLQRAVAAGVTMPRVDMLYRLLAGGEKISC